MKSIKAKEPIMHRYIDIFVEKMKQIGNEESGIELRTVSFVLSTPGIKEFSTAS